MTTNLTEAHSATPAAMPLALKSNDVLGPNVRNLKALAALRRGAPLHDASETEAVWCDNAVAEIERLRAALAAMRPMLDKRRIAWKKHADYINSVLGPNEKLTGRPP